MAQSRESTGHANQAAPRGQRLWAREADTASSFWWRGALPVLTLGAVLAYNLSAFAQRTQTQVRLEVSEQLAEHELGWVRVEADGQHVRLSGQAPSAEASARAVAVASQATCQSWLGELTCARRVTTRFEAAGSIAPGGVPRAAGTLAPARELNGATNATAPNAAAPQAVASAAPDAVVPGTTSADPVSPPAASDGQRFFDLTVTRTGNALELKGDVATAELRSALEASARTHFPSGTLDNRLNVIGGGVSPAWEPAAKHAVEVAARCEQGVITLANATLSVDCETQTAAAKDAINGLVKQQLPGLSTGTVSVLALDEVKSCEEGLVKLVTRSQVRFTTNSAKLLPTSRPLLREIAHQLERCPGVVVVEGHTDGQGVREENVTLSLNRARAVVSGLVGLGVPAARVRAEGFGPDRPLATNETATGRAQNRRIEFRVARTSMRGQ